MRSPRGDGQVDGVFAADFTREPRDSVTWRAADEGSPCLCREASVGLSLTLTCSVHRPIPWPSAGPWKLHLPGSSATWFQLGVARGVAGGAWQPGGWGGRRQAPQPLSGLHPGSSGWLCQPSQLPLSPAPTGRL